MPARDSLMTGRPPIPYGLVGDGTESVNWRMLAACLDRGCRITAECGWRSEIWIRRRFWTTLLYEGFPQVDPGKRVLSRVF